MDNRSGEYNVRDGQEGSPDRGGAEGYQVIRQGYQVIRLFLRRVTEGISLRGTDGDIDGMHPPPASS
jgi:hypothetical protein